ncbi:hypothetical protein DER72_1145 [Halomonas sp. A11-A]|nr:hypothetical protein DER72_1145 [Halomonas sp. A11-A]
MSREVYGVSQGVVTYQVREEALARPEEVRLGSSSPSFLRPLLGRAHRRRSLLASGVNWERILFIEVDGEVAGYLQFYLGGEGPHRLGHEDLRPLTGPARVSSPSSFTLTRMSIITSRPWSSKAMMVRSCSLME